MNKLGRALLAVLILFVVAGVVVIAVSLIVDDDDDESAAKARIVSVAKLREIARDDKRPIYWVGDPRDFQVELSQADGSSYVRYLPPDVKAGSKRPDYLTVGTYPFRNAFADLKRNAEANGDDAVTRSAPGDGRLLYYKQRPTSVYLAYPETAYLIEVYDPNEETALKLVRDGAVTPVP